MKRLLRIAISYCFLLTFILACTKDIDLKTEVEFSLIEQHKAEGYLNEDLPTTVTVVPEEELEEFSYAYAYSVSKGEGHFEDEEGTIFPQNKNIALNPFSASMMYIGSKTGEHIVKVTATDNYGFTEEIEIDYRLTEAPVIWTAISPVQRMELGNSATITVTFERGHATEINYESSYGLVSGSGTLTELPGENEIELEEFKSIFPGTYQLRFTPDVLGTMELSFDLRDENGKEFNATVNFEVLEEIVDTVAPEILILGDNPLTIARGGTFEDPGATATDDVDGDISAAIVVDTSSMDTSVVGSYRISYNVSDSAGNAATERIRTIEVIAGDTPQNDKNEILAFAVPEQIATAVIDLNSHTVTANVPFGTDVNVAPLVLTISPGATVAPSENAVQNFQNTVTYVVTAENGDSQDWTVKVNVNAPSDTTPPVIALTGDDPQIIEVGQNYTELGATAVDNFDGDITTGIIINSSAVNTNQIGDYTVTYNVSDASGNAADQKTRTVRVSDTTPPIISLSGGSSSILVGQSYIEPGYSAIDNVDGNITGNVTVGGGLDTNTVGTYTVTYNVIDAAGNAAVQMTRTVQVIDNTIPEITLSGANVTMSVGEVYNEPGYSASDNVDGNITGNVVVGGNLDTNTLGIYTVTYNVSDAAGNTAAEKTRTVRVVDTTLPEITLSGANVTISVGEAFSDPGYSASDNVDGNITGNVVVGGNLDTNTVGTYTVTYDVNDASGNAATQKTRTVRVIDTTPPVIVLTGGNVSMEMNTSFTDPGYSATDNVDGNIANRVVVGGNLDTSRVGIYTVSYNVSDTAGNTAIQQTRTVTVYTPPPSASFSGSTNVSMGQPSVSGTVTIENGPMTFSFGITALSANTVRIILIINSTTYEVSSSNYQSNSLKVPGSFPPGTYSYSLSVVGLGNFSGGVIAVLP